VWVLESKRIERDVLVLVLVTFKEDGALGGRRSVRVHEGYDGQLEVGQPVPEHVLGAELLHVPVELPADTRDPHPVHMTVTDELRRSRLLTFFRLPLAFPHLVWLVLWAIPIVFTLFLAWLCALVVGRVPTPFHRFLARYARYGTHLWAFLLLVGNPFPGFTGREGSYPVDLAIPAPEPQKRSVTFFRSLLGIPAILIAGGLYGALYTAAFLGWFVALFLGRMPAGFRNLGAYVLRYGGQLTAYLYLLTPRYPDSGPRPDPTSP
jgi:hypothetical protein